MKRKFLDFEMNTPDIIKTKKRIIEANQKSYPIDWKINEIMVWGGQVLESSEKTIYISNTCPIDNFLWICRCWYASHPLSLDYINMSDDPLLRNLGEVFSLLLNDLFF